MKYIWCVHIARIHLTAGVIFQFMGFSVRHIFDLTHYPNFFLGMITVSNIFVNGYPIFVQWYIARKIRKSSGINPKLQIHILQKIFVEMKSPNYFLNEAELKRLHFCWCGPLGIQTLGINPHKGF